MPESELLYHIASYCHHSILYTGKSWEAIADRFRLGPMQTTDSFKLAYCIIQYGAIDLNVGPCLTKDTKALDRFTMFYLYY